MHALNHPDTVHYREDMGSLDPLEVTHGKHVRLAWFSPDCTHFSRAKGGTPVSKKIRGLAWCIPKWAAAVRPDIIMMENVREFLTWGPLMRKRYFDKKAGRHRMGWFPDPKKAGQTFKRWRARLENLGYTFEYKVLNAADYGAPTNRRRLFIIMRCDGQPTVWPEPTHGPGRLPYRTAAECIDWSIPCPSIFDRKRPHKPKTLDRIARGIIRYVINNPKPFIVRIGQTGSNGGNVNSVDDPLTTVVSKNEHCVVDPFVVKVNHGGKHFRGQPAAQPLSTITGAHGAAIVAPHISTYNGTNKESNRFRGAAVDEPVRTVTGSPRHSVVAAELEKLDVAAGVVNTRNGERKGQKPRVKPITDPLNTVTSKDSQAVVVAHVQRDFGNSTGQCADAPMPTVMPGGGRKTGLVAAFINKHFGGVVGQKADQPQPTVMPRDHSSITAVNLAKFRGNSDGQKADQPMPTITSGAGAKRPAGAAHALGVVAATLVKNNHGEPSAKPVDGPMPTVTTQSNRTTLAAANLVRFNHGEKQWNGCDEPLGVVTAQGNKAGLVYSFLTKHYSSGGQHQGCDEPLHTISTKDRFGIVTVEIEGETYVITDIGLRMFQPRELATAQGFSKDYILTGPKDNQVAKIGNSVPPPMVAALVKANWSKKWRSPRRSMSPKP